MKAETIVLVLGGLLLLSAVVGGGFEVKEVKIPRISGWARALAGIAGALLLAVGISMSNPPPDPPGPDNGGVPDHGSVTFSLLDELGEGQVSEQVRVLIDGRERGTLTVNDRFPSARIRIDVPKAGQYGYDLEATAQFRDANGQVYEIVGVGQGIVAVEDGKTYKLVSTLTGSTWIAHMEEVEKK